VFADPQKERLLMKNPTKSDETPIPASMEGKTVGGKPYSIHPIHPRRPSNKKVALSE